MQIWRQAIDTARASKDIASLYDELLIWKDDGKLSFQELGNREMRICKDAVRAADAALSLGLSEPEIEGGGAQLHYEVRLAVYEAKVAAGTF